MNRGTKDPVYNERFNFKASRSTLPTRTVRCVTYTCDKYTNSILGQCEVKISDIDLNETFKSWLPLVDNRTVRKWKYSKSCLSKTETFFLKSFFDLTPGLQRVLVIYWYWKKKFNREIAFLHMKHKNILTKPISLTSQNWLSAECVRSKCNLY